MFDLKRMDGQGFSARARNSRKELTMNILMTGGTGFIGASLADVLVRSGLRGPILTRSAGGR